MAQPGFRLPLDREVFGWTQFVAEPWETSFADYPTYGVAAWLPPGVDVATARAELASLAPPPAESRLESLEVRVGRLGELYRPDDGGVLTLFAAVTLVLLLGSLNTAQLLVARGLARGPDLAVRAALGSGRRALGSGRRALGRMLLVEAALLVAAGTAAGLLIAVVLLRVFVAADPGHLPGGADVRITSRVAVYLACVSVAASLLAGWLPARLAWRTAPAAALAAAKGATPGRRRVRMQRLLLAGQSAAAVMLLVGCVLLVRSWLAVQASDPGVGARDVYAARIVLPSDRYPPGDGAVHVRFFDALRRGVEARSGIAGASVAFAVSRGRREIGVRLALGADAGSVIRTTTGPTLLAFGAGVGLGLLGSLALARLASALLFGIEPLDGWSMVAACAVLLAVGAVAALVPALRAVRADPVEALRVG
ncbi:MAG: FtsX-like permease family protein [Gemmatimonadota bacterium]